MVTVKALRTTLDETGFIKKGHTSQMGERRAKLLVDKGLVEILSEDDGTEEVATVVRGGVRIKDVTGDISATDERKVIKKDQPVKLGVETVANDGKKMPESYTDGTQKADVPEPIPEKAETSKTEPAETQKAEVKETPKKKYS